MDCLTCRDLASRNWPRLLDEWRWKDKEVYPTYEQVQLSALQCELCQILVEGIRNVAGEVNDMARILIDGGSRPLSVIIWRDDGLHDYLEFYTLQGNASSYISTEAHHVPRDLSLDYALARILGWVSMCDQSHEECHSHSSFAVLPNRILHVDPSRSEDLIFLEETEGWKRGRYMTLSHCWGDQEHITTTSSSLPRRKAGIPIQDLPPTFRDAVQLTRGLGIEYLWIDSLCIIQDSISDWEKESALMGAVYSASYLNIAATHSSGSSGGCLSQRWIPSKTVDSSGLPISIPLSTYNSINSQASTNIRVYVRRSFELAHEEISRRGTSEYTGAGYGWRPYTDTAPLLSRGWAFQERILSPRIVHFHASELFWDCRLKPRCECGVLDLSEYTSGFRPALFNRTVASMAEQWQAMCAEYSALALTVSTDKLPALSGIATRFAARVQSTYLAGLWKSHLPSQLLWRVDYHPSGGPPTKEHFVPVRAHPFRAPTWSWASLDIQSSVTRYGCPISWNLAQDAIHPLFEVQHAECVVEGDNPFGRVSSGTLIVKSAVIHTEYEMTNVNKWSRFYKVTLNNGHVAEPKLIPSGFYGDVLSQFKFGPGVRASHRRPILKVLVVTATVGMVVQLVINETLPKSEVEAGASASATTAIEPEAQKTEEEEYYERVGLIMLHECGMLVDHAQQGIFRIR